MDKFIFKIIPVCFLIGIMPIGLHAQVDVLYVDDTLKERIILHLDTVPIYKQKYVELDETSVRKAVDAMPSFGIYRDMFFVTGIPLYTKINSNTADAMFQVSIRQRLTKSHFPFNSFLYLTYTQKSFWDIYSESSPFRDTNYNPGIGFGRYLVHNNKLKGAGFIQIEHESNGRDGTDSRSWNYLSLSSKYFFNLRLSLGLEIWIPFVDGKENKDLLDYRGLGVASINYISKDAKWWLSSELNPRKGLGNVNTTINIAYKLSKSHNQYLFARFYNGKGDSLLDYNKYTMNVRLGICIKPDFLSIY